MRQQQIVKKVNSVLQDSIGVFVDNSEGLCDINENLIQKGDYFNTSNGYIYGYDGEATIVKINDVFKKISLGYTSGCKVFSSNSIICYKLHIKENVVDYLLLNDDKETNFHIAGRNIPVYREGNKIIFTDKKKQIFLYDVRSNDIIWSYTCPEGRKIEGNLYAYQEVLAFIEGDEEGETTLVGLDIHSGEILYKEVVGLIHYQQQDNKLYGFASTTFGDNTYSGSCIRLVGFSVRR
ncbi:hypothetical protein PG279_06815 [Riemerella anatipestifer]|nr:hypothetical protein [Riemerella anatipestifer]